MLWGGRVDGKKRGHGQNQMLNDIKVKGNYAYDEKNGRRQGTMESRYGEDLTMCQNTEY